VITLAIIVNTVIIYYIDKYNAGYIIVKISGDAELFNGIINSINDKGEIKSIKLNNELPQEHKIKTQKVYCQIKLIKGKNLFVEYWLKGKLSEKDTVNSDLYKKIFSIHSHNKREY
jgi:hypothetical protein